MPQDSESRQQILRPLQPRGSRKERSARHLAVAVLPQGAAGKRAAPRGWPYGYQGRHPGLRPARVLMQDFTGVPAVVDLAAMRDAMKNLGGDPKRINPLVPVDLVIDHS